MKPVHTLALTALIILLLVVSGCTQEQKEKPAATTAATPATQTVTPAATTRENPYPNATALVTTVPFGTGDMTGTMTVTKYYIRPAYNWTSPSWRSAREQATYAPGNEVQTGYNTEKPADGNTFIIVYVRFACTGDKAVYAPSPQQIAIVADGKAYQYHPVSDSGVVIDGITGTQYDYLVGKGGTGGYVQPGASNVVEGYLIYEIPAGVPPERIFVLANPDYKTNAEWKLV